MKKTFATMMVVICCLVVGIAKASKQSRNDFSHYQGRLSAPSSEASKGRQAKISDPSAQEYKLVINGIKPLAVSEKSGDELYLDVLTYGDHHKPKHYLMPPAPYHWVSAAIKKVKNVQVWHGTIDDKGEQTLIISLIDKDAPPWNIDDLIGAFKLQMKRKNGKVVFQYTQLDENMKPQQLMGKFNKTIEMKGNNAHYQVSISMK